LSVIFANFCNAFQVRCKQARAIIVSKATRVTAQVLYKHRGRKC